MPKYKAILFSVDGEDFVTDYRGKSVEEIQGLLANQGSKWYFYPFHAIVVDHGATSDSQRIVDAAEPFEDMKGKSVKTFQNMIKSLTEMELQRIFGYL